MTQEEFLGDVAKRLDSAGIPFMLVGSHGSAFHSQPRTTNDLDIVIDPTAEQLDQFLAGLGKGFYVSPTAAYDALRRRGMFNILQTSYGWKADLIVRKNRPFSVEEFSRRTLGRWHGYDLPIVTAEDVVLAKLEWNRITPSERQLGDVYNVLAVQGSRLDRPYLRQWAAVLGVGEQLEEMLRRVDAASASE